MELIIFISAHCQCGELMHHDPLSSGEMPWEVWALGLALLLECSLLGFFFIWALWLYSTKAVLWCQGFLCTSGHCRPKLGFNLSLLAHCAMGIEKKNLVGNKWSGVLVGNWGPKGEVCIDTSNTSLFQCFLSTTVNAVSFASRGIMEQRCFLLAFTKLMLACKLRV